MFDSVRPSLREELNDLDAKGLYKRERVIITPQSATIRTDQGGEVLNFCANNYLGLSSHPEVIRAAKEAIDTRLRNVQRPVYLRYTGYS